MIYSVLYGHLNKQYVKVGDKLVYGSKVGEMGNTGQVSPMPTKEKPNAGTHLHLSVVEGKKTGTWTLASMNSTNKPSQQQCKYFIDDDIFSTFDKTEITAGWLSYTNHYAYDIIPKNRKHYDLYWNRSFTGIVSAVGKNAGYGNYVIVQYDTSVKTPLNDNSSNKEENSNTNTSSQLKAEIEALKQELGQVKSEKEQLLVNNQSYVVENSELIKEKQVLEDRINLIEQENARLREDYVMLQNSSDDVEDNLRKELEEIKHIYTCQKDGTYRIKLKQNYKLYISD